MIYFFTRGRQFTQCEIHPGLPHLLRRIEPSGAEWTEQYASSAEVQDRWAEMTAELCYEGWLGPFGRDSRA